MSKRKNISDTDYLMHLKQQYDFLKSDLAEYEAGKPHFGVKIASTLRTIFHDTSNSTAILPKLANKYGLCLQFRAKANDHVYEDSTTFYVGFKFGIRQLDKDHFNAPFFFSTDFNTYWNSPVYKEGSVIYKRNQIILFAANKYGGSHVDPQIPDEFLRLVDGSGPKLLSEQCGEEMIITRVAYESGIQVVLLLEELISILEQKIAH